MYIFFMTVTDKKFYRLPYIFYKLLLVITFIPSIGSQQKIEKRIVVIENSNIPPNIKGN